MTKKFYREQKIIKTTLLKNYYKLGLNGIKVWQFPVCRTYEYYFSNEPKRLTANYKGYCHNSLFHFRKNVESRNSTSGRYL